MWQSGFLVCWLLWFSGCSSVFWPVVLLVLEGLVFCFFGHLVLPCFFHDGLFFGVRMGGNSHRKEVVGDVHPASNRRI